MKYIDIDIGTYDTYSFKQQTPIFQLENNATTLECVLSEIGAKLADLEIRVSNLEQ